MPSAPFSAWRLPSPNRARGLWKPPAEQCRQERAGLLKAPRPLVDWLVLAVAGGVGAAVVLRFLRYLFRLADENLVFLDRSPCLGSPLLPPLPGLDRVIRLAWDCGGITTGPVTVPSFWRSVSALPPRRAQGITPVGIRHCHPGFAAPRPRRFCRRHCSWPASPCRQLRPALRPVVSPDPLCRNAGRFCAPSFIVLLLYFVQRVVIGHRMQNVDIFALRHRGRRSWHDGLQSQPRRVSWN